MVLNSERGKKIFILVMVVLVTLFFSIQWSLNEAKFYSTRIGTLEAVKPRQKDNAVACNMIEIKRKLAEPIAVILIPGAFSDTAGAIVAGMRIHQILVATLVLIFSILIILTILFLAEIIPKHRAPSTSGC